MPPFPLRPLDAAPLDMPSLDALRLDIVGLACRLPGADTPKRFFELGQSAT